MRKNDLTARVHQLQRRQQGAQQTEDAADYDDAISVHGFLPRVPDGRYEAKYIGHDTALVFTAPKCFLHFQIVQFGDHFETKLFRAFRVRRLIGRPGKGGKFVLHARSDLYPLLCKLLDVRMRLDRITFRPLRSMLFSIATRTVIENYKHEEMPEHSRYGVIASIERQQ